MVMAGRRRKAEYCTAGSRGRVSQKHSHKADTRGHLPKRGALQPAPGKLRRLLDLPCVCAVDIGMRCGAMIT